MLSAVQDINGNVEYSKPLGESLQFPIRVGPGVPKKGYKGKLVLVEPLLPIEVKLGDAVAFVRLSCHDKWGYKTAPAVGAVWGVISTKGPLRFPDHKAVTSSSMVGHSRLRAISLMCSCFYMINVSD